MSFIQKLRSGLIRSRTRSVEEQIEKVRQETESARSQILNERRGQEKRLRTRLDQKEINDLEEAERALRTKPFNGEDAIEDLKTLSRILSRLIGVSDDGKQADKKLSLLQVLADAAKVIGPINGPYKIAGQDRAGTGRAQNLMDEIIDDLRANRLLDACHAINRAVNAVPASGTLKSPARTQLKK
jgi:hypothetical protein